MKIERPKSKQPIPENAKKVFGGILFDVYQWEQKMFDGSKETYEKLKRPDTVVIYPILPNGKILITEQEQSGVEGQFIALPGGRVDLGEDILEAAKRELLEETGYEAEEFILWNAIQPTSKIEWAVYTFIAKGLRKIADLNLDAGEKIKLKEIALADLIDISASGRLSDMEMRRHFLEAKFSAQKFQEIKRLFE